MRFEGTPILAVLLTPLLTAPMDAVRLLEHPGDQGALAGVHREGTIVPSVWRSGRPWSVGPVAPVAA